MSVFILDSRQLQHLLYRGRCTDEQDSKYAEKIHFNMISDLISKILPIEDEWERCRRGKLRSDKWISVPYGEKYVFVCLTSLCHWSYLKAVNADVSQKNSVLHRSLCDNMDKALLYIWQVLKTADSGKTNNGDIL